METKKENKKGFWASLFSPKPCSCSRGDKPIVEEVEKTGVKQIKVLGPGCAKCKATYQAIEQAAKENHLDVKLTKIEDIVEIMSYNVMGTPAVVVDGEVKIKGHVPSESEIKQILGI